MRAGTADIHVLLIRLSALGDVVHTLPAAAFLRENLPEAKLTWIVEAPFVELLENNPVVDEVIIFPKKKISKELSNPMRWLSPNSELRQFINQLKSRNFTAAIDFQGLFKSGAIAFLSGAPTRVGFAQSRELSSWLMTDKCDTGDYFANDKHVALHNLELAEFFLRIAGGAKEKSRIISFPLPDPGAEIFSDVLKLLSADVHQTSQNVSSASDPGSRTTRKDAAPRSAVQPPAETDDVVLPVEPDATNSAAAANANGVSGGVEPSVESKGVQPPVQPSIEASELISKVPASGVISQPKSESTPQSVPMTKIPQTPGWSMFPGPCLGATETSHIDRAIASRTAGGETLVVLIPGTTWITKIWPKEKWSDLVSQLVQIHNVRIVLIGGPAETGMNRYIYDSVSNQRSDGAQIIDLTGKTSLRGLVALFMMADIVVGADTGPLHIASAVSVPNVIGVYGSTPWGRNGPLGNKTSVVALSLSCQPCFEKTCPITTLACLKELEVDQVFNEVKRAIGEVQPD